MTKLHLGCGQRIFKGWEHIDKADYPHIKTHDVKSLPYKPNSASVIYASHLLEYFDREEAIKVLKDWLGVLKTGGEIYLSVPDFKQIAFLYLRDGVPLHSFLGPLYGKMQVGDRIDYHKTVYDYQSLGDLLRFIGFKKIELWDHKEFFPKFPEAWPTPKDSHGYLPLSQLEEKRFFDCSNARINGELISLNIKAVKE